jgi:hypothetical protein
MGLQSSLKVAWLAMLPLPVKETCFSISGSKEAWPCIFALPMLEEDCSLVALRAVSDSTLNSAAHKPECRYYRRPMDVTSLEVPRLASKAPNAAPEALCAKYSRQDAVSQDQKHIQFESCMRDVSTTHRPRKGPSSMSCFGLSGRSLK